MDPSELSNCKEVFTDIYARRVWGEGSGGGSDPDQAAPYVRFINEWIAKHRPKTILDIGVGDGRIFRSLAIPPGTFYMGIDAIALPHMDPFRVEGSIFFEQMDATESVPEAQLILCKEVLQHLSNTQVEQVLRNMEAHNGDCLIASVTVPPDAMNTDIHTGSTRPVDITLPPFNRKAETVLKYNHGNNHLHVQWIRK